MLLPLLLLLSLLPLSSAQDPVPSQLSNSTQCRALGFDSLEGYLARLPLSSPYGRPSSEPVFLPLYATLPAGLSGAAVYDNITTAVIYIHGLLGSANSYFCAGAAAGRGHEGVLTLAPWFGNEQVDAATWGAPAGERGASAFWTAASRWLTGGNTSPSADGGAPATRYSTAFDALDALIAALRSGGGFPSLRLITVAGFSAGAQLTSRYALASAEGAPPAPGAPAVRLLVSDPASLLYLDAARPAPACRPLRDTGEGWACQAGFAPPPEAPDCADYEVYKYGTREMGYQNGYCAKFDAEPALLEAAVRAYAGKDVAYILGTGDVCNCNAPGFDNAASCYIVGADCLPNAAGGPGCCDTAPDGHDNKVDFSCEAMVQGSNRLQRGLLYFQYLQQLYAARGEPFRQRIAFGSFAHNNSGEYASDAFQRLAFDP